MTPHVGSHWVPVNMVVTSTPLSTHQPRVYAQPSDDTIKDHFTKYLNAYSTPGKFETKFISVSVKAAAKPVNLESKKKFNNQNAITDIMWDQVAERLGPGTSARGAEQDITILVTTHKTNKQLDCLNAVLLSIKAYFDVRHARRIPRADVIVEFRGRC